MIFNFMKRLDHYVRSSEVSGRGGMMKKELAVISVLAVAIVVLSVVIWIGV